MSLETKSAAPAEKGGAGATKQREGLSNSTPSIAPRPDGIKRFLGSLRPDGPWVLTAIVPDGKTATRTFTEADKAADWAARENDKGRNLYYSLNPTKGEVSCKTSKGDIARVAYLAVDIDPRGGEDIEKERKRALSLLTDRRPDVIPAPTAIVFSGGGYQALWALSPDDRLEIGGDADRAAEIERYNIQLEKVFGADACHNVDRILRVPGTVNWPNEKKRKKGRERVLAELVEWNDVAYSIDDFTKAPPKGAQAVGLNGGQTPKVNVEGAPADVSVADLQAWAEENGATITDSTLAIIANGTDPNDPDRHESRSEWLFRACCDLVRAGVPDEMTYGVISGGNKIAASVRDKPNPEQYALRQIERAKEHAVDPALAELNARHAVIGNIGGKCRIIEERYDPGMKRSRLDKQSFEDFRNRYSNRRVQSGTDDKGNPKYEPLGKWWIAQPMRRQYESIVFAPGQEPEGVYNLWRGFDVEPAPGAGHESFLAHLCDNVCAGDPERYDYLIGWMARAVQRPDTQGEVAVVMRGKRGTGKSFFVKHFGRLFGRHYLQVSNGRHLVGNFNSHLRDTVLLFGDEAFFAGDKQHESVLKTLITEDQLVVEQKGVDAEAAPNYTHVVLASNDDWVVPAGLDERRFLVLDVGEARQKDLGYFKGIQDELEAGGYGNLLRYLLDYDLSGFEVRAVPNTAALRDQQAESLRGFEAYLFERLWSGDLPDVADVNGLVPTSKLVEEVVRWLRDRPPSQRAKVTAKSLGDSLKKLGAHKKLKRRTGNINGYQWDAAYLRELWDKAVFAADWPSLAEAEDEETRRRKNEAATEAARLLRAQYPDLARRYRFAFENREAF